MQIVGLWCVTLPDQEHIGGKLCVSGFVCIAHFMETQMQRPIVFCLYECMKNSLLIFLSQYSNVIDY